MRFAAVLALAAILSATPAGAVRQSADELRAGEIKVIAVEPFAYCALSRTGAFEEIEAAIDELWTAMQDQNVAPAGPLMAVFLDDPSRTDSGGMRWEVGFPMMAQAASVLQPPLERREWIYPTVAGTLHVGRYEAAGDAIVKIQDWLAENGYVAAGPVVERYLDMDPDAVKPEELRTEIWVACRKS